MQPVIFHIDMDAFFVSVEELFDPTLRGKVVVVGGSPTGRGVVSAASYAARKFGIHSAMPLRTAHALCPQAIFLPGRRKAYEEYSQQVFEIFSSFSPVVEMISIDEAYLDFTGAMRLYGHPFPLAHRLRQAIVEKTGLSASIGISSSRLVSKVASDMAKPAGILHVWPGRETVFLAPLSVGKIPGIGRVTEQQLNQMGIGTVGQLAAVDLEFLRQRFGQWGEALCQKARGCDTAHFEFREEPKSISNEHTFQQDTTDAEALEKTLGWLVQKTTHRLREHGMHARTITLKLRDHQFHTVTRAKSLEEPTELDKIVLDTVQELFRREWDKRKPIRLLGVALSGLGAGEFQHDLFQAPERERWGRLYEAADQVRGKYGFDAVTSARTMKPEKGRKGTS